MTIYTVIAKPTRECNADCRYCCAPPFSGTHWGAVELERVMGALSGKLAPGASFIWHGGEPMLLGPEFYRTAQSKAWEAGLSPHFAMQSNLLLYRSSRWRRVFDEVFEGRISTSFDARGAERTIRGDASRYRRAFLRQIDAVTRDGFHPLVITTLTEQTADGAHDLYDLAHERGGLDIRLNYCNPVGRAQGAGQKIRPETYARVLQEVYNRWLTDTSALRVTPLDQMLAAVIGVEKGERCPWTRRCGGRFLAIEPDGRVFNCSEFADLREDRYCFGNLFEGALGEANACPSGTAAGVAPEVLRFALASPAAVEIRRRAIRVQPDCQACAHFRECGGGCARDSVLFDRAGEIGSKFHYCLSWKRTFERIKVSVLSGEADARIERSFGPEGLARAKRWREGVGACGP